MKAGLGDHDPVKIVIPAFQPLGKDVPAEGTEHTEDMGFSDILWFVTSQHPHREHVKGIEYLLRSVGAEAAYDLPASACFPLSRIVVAIIVPFLELFNHVIPPLIMYTYWYELPSFFCCFRGILQVQETGLIKAY